MIFPKRLGFGPLVSIFTGYVVQHLRPSEKLSRAPLHYWGSPLDFGCVRCTWRGSEDVWGSDATFRSNLIEIFSLISELSAIVEGLRLSCSRSFRALVWRILWVSAFSPFPSEVASVFFQGDRTWGMLLLKNLLEIFIPDLFSCCPLTMKSSTGGIPFPLTGLFAAYVFPFLVLKKKILK